MVQIWLKALIFTVWDTICAWSNISPLSFDNSAPLAIALFNEWAFEKKNVLLLWIHGTKDHWWLMTTHKAWFDQYTKANSFTIATSYFKWSLLNRSLQNTGLGQVQKDTSVLEIDTLLLFMKYTCHKWNQNNLHLPVGYPWPGNMSVCEYTCFDIFCCTY
jgi:hypothetical protein